MYQCLHPPHSQCLNALHSDIASKYATLLSVLTLSTPMLECFTFRHSQCFCSLHSNIANVMGVLGSVLGVIWGSFWGSFGGLIMLKFKHSRLSWCYQPITNLAARALPIKMVEQAMCEILASVARCAKTWLLLSSYLVFSRVAWKHCWNSVGPVFKK